MISTSSKREWSWDGNEWSVIRGGLMYTIKSDDKGSYWVYEGSEVCSVHNQLSEAQSHCEELSACWW